MRTTVELDADTAQAVASMCREEGRGVDEVVNELIRRSVRSKPSADLFIPRTRRLGIRVDVSKVGEAVGLLEGPHR